MLDTRSSMSWVNDGAASPALVNDMGAAAIMAIAPASRARVVAAMVFAILADAIVAAVVTGKAHAGLAAILLSGIEVGGFLTLPLVLVSLPVIWLVELPSVRAFGLHFRSTISGGRAGVGNVALLLYAVAVALGATGTSWIALRVAEHQSTRVVVLFAVTCGMSCVLAGAMAVAIVVARLAFLVDRISKRIPPAALHPAVPALCFASAGIVALFCLIPPPLAIPPAAALLGAALGPLLSLRVARFRAMSGRSAGVALVGFAIVASCAATLALKRLPGTAQLGAISRAPYTSLLIATARAALDRDRDGYSPYLLGGDCDDRNASIHPTAVDIPGNGIDENCSGADAHDYQPPVQLAAIPPSPSPAKRINIALIQMDALRPDHLRFAGYRRPTSKRIDEFRAGATWFRNAYTPAPTTRLAMAAIFTGREIDEIPQSRGPGIDFTLLPAAVTLAERLEPLGYERVGYTISYVLQHIREMGQGFQKWDTPWPVDDWSRTYENAATLTTNAGIAYLEGASTDETKPYFMFLHYQCTHDPYVLHSEWDYGASEADLYDSALSYCDQQLGRLLDAMDKRADRDRTAVILFSDHGELFGEHGLTRHGNSLFEPDVRSLLLARIPGGRVSTVDDPVTLTDLAPTILELAGAPRDPASQAWSLVPYARGPAAIPPLRRPMFLYADLWRNGIHYQARGLVDGSYKYVRDIGAGMNQLFDLDRDPYELSNLADTMPAVSGRMSEHLDSWEAYQSRH